MAVSWNHDSWALDPATEDAKANVRVVRDHLTLNGAMALAAAIKAGTFSPAGTVWTKDEVTPYNSVIPVPPTTNDLETLVKGYMVVTGGGGMLSGDEFTVDDIDFGYGDPGVQDVFAHILESYL